MKTLKIISDTKPESCQDGCPFCVVGFCVPQQMSINATLYLSCPIVKSDSEFYWRRGVIEHVVGTPDRNALGQPYTFKKEYEDKLIELGVFERFKANWEKGSPTTTIIHMENADCFEGFVYRAFLFSETQEGHEFWVNISHQ